MKQRLGARLSELERFSAATRSTGTSQATKEALEKLWSEIDVLTSTPEFQKRMAEMPPEVLAERVREFEAEIDAKANRWQANQHRRGDFR